MVGVAVVLLGGVMVASMRSDDRRSASIAFPDRPADAESKPIGTAPDGGTSDEFSFSATQEDSSDPVTYDPCAPIHVVVDPRTIVDRGMRLLDEAIDEVQDATGLVFVVDGVTDEPRPDDVDLTDSDGGWRPVRVSWSDPARDDELAGAVAGVGGSSSVRRDDRSWYVTGAVVLDGPQLAEVLGERRGWQAARSVVMHELAHVVGLAHVQAPGQLMRPEADVRITTWGEGDRAGLAALGRGPRIDY